MPPIDYQTIQRIATDFARSLHLWLSGKPEAGALTQSSPERLAAVLEPGIAAFVGRLTTLIPAQQEALPEILTRYFAMPAAIEAFGRHLTGVADASDELFRLLLDAGAEDNARLHSYFHQALEFMVAAIAWSGASEVVEEAKSPPAAIDEMAASLNLSPYLLEDMQAFVASMAQQGLDRIETGAAVAADGATILFEWQPVLMSAGPPEEWPDSGADSGPDSGAEMAESEGPDEATAGPPPPPPPAPPPPPPTVPATGGGSVAPDVVALRLDAALPERVTVGRVFELAVAIMRPASPARPIADLQRRESADFAALWPAEAAFIQLRVQISAPDCLIHDGDSRPVRLLAGQDGPTVYFQLTPQHTGPLSVIITVYQEMDWVGSTRLRTEAGAEEPRGALAVTVESHPLSSPEVSQVALWKAIGKGYNVSELQALCFVLEIDYDDLPGETKTDKARELVQYADRHGIMARLVAQLMADRPHLLAA